MSALDKKIIISADDFGQGPKVNTDLLELLSLGKLQRVSVTIDGNFSPEEIRLLINSQAKIDLHLDFFNLLKGNQAWRKKTGAFIRLLVFFKDYLSGRISVPRVAKNWDQQLKKFNQIFGRYPSGLNSHEHIHFFPPYFKLISDLAEKSGISYIRFGKKDFIKTTNIVSLILFGLRKINRRRFENFKLISADFLISLDWLKKFNTAELNQLPPGEIELLIHPEKPAELEFIKTHTFI